MKDSHQRVDEVRLHSNEDGMGDQDEPATLDLGIKQRKGFDYFSSNAQGAQGSQMKIESSERAH